MTDASRIWITILLSLWVLTYGYSVVAFAVTEPTGEGFTRGSNRIMAFLGWQAISGMFAVPIWVIGRNWPKRSGVRRIAKLPILLAAFLIAALLALVVWARFLA